MFDLVDQLPDSFEYEGLSGPLDLSFDNVLNVYRQLKREDVSESARVRLVCYLLTGEMYDAVSIDQVAELVTYLYKTYIDSHKPQLTSDHSEKQQAELYDLDEDADYIFASFMQDYGMDLLEQRGKLHWYKFCALLAGLTEQTKFMQVLSIRSADPNEKGLSSKQKHAIREAQLQYQLHVTNEDVAFSKLDMLEKDQYLRDHPDYLKRISGN